MNILETEQLGKTLKKRIIFRDVNLHFESGYVYALVGANGSGKTMLLRILAGLVHPSEGRILLNGQEYIPTRKRSLSTGIMIENMNLYPDMTGFQNLKCLSKIRNLISDTEIRETIANVGLDPGESCKVGKFSLGMRQKLIFAQAVMEQPSLLLLDEPTNALDTESVQRVHQIIQKMAKQGSIVVIASHNRADIETVCDKVYVFGEGTARKEGE